MEGCCKIVLLDKDEEGLSETARLCKAQSDNIRTFVIPLDVRSESEIDASMDLVIEEWGRIDYAVNCAGECPFSSTGPRTGTGDQVEYGGGKLNLRTRNLRPLGALARS